jgi:Asp/Glu/hydantoin racemase
MGVEARMGAPIVLNLDLEVLTDPSAPRARVREVARDLVALGAGAMILGGAGDSGAGGGAG